MRRVVPLYAFHAGYVYNDALNGRYLGRPRRVSYDRERYDPVVRVLSAPQTESYATRIITRDGYAYQPSDGEMTEFDAGNSVLIYGFIDVFWNAQQPSKTYISFEDPSARDYARDNYGLVISTNRVEYGNPAYKTDVRLYKKVIILINRKPIGVARILGTDTDAMGLGKIVKDAIDTPDTKIPAMREIVVPGYAIVDAVAKQGATLLLARKVDNETL